MTRAALLSVVVACCAVPGSAAELRTLLPAAAPGEAAVRAGAIAEYDAATLSNFIDGGAEVYLDYGFVRAATAEYGSGDGAVTCTVYEMNDPQAAFGVFSYFRAKPADGIQVGDGAFGSDLQLAFWQDRYFATIESFSTDARTRGVLAAFARAISARIGTHAALPAVLDRLPADPVKGSERLLRGRVAENALYTAWPSTALPFGDGEVLVAAQYPLSGANVTLWLARFRDPAGLERAWTSAVAKFRPDAGCQEPQDVSRSSRANELVCTAGGWVRLARRHGAALVVVSGAKSVEDASALVGRVRP